MFLGFIFYVVYILCDSSPLWLLYFATILMKWYANATIASPFQSIYYIYCYILSICLSIYTFWDGFSVNRSAKLNHIVFMRTNMLILWCAKCFCYVNNFLSAQCSVFACMTHARDQNRVLVVSLNLYCELKLCTVISTLRWAVLTVLWIGFCHISLCIGSFVFICVCFVCFCFIPHMCCIIVSTVGWTWWDWSLILRTYLAWVFWHCWLGHLSRKIPSPIQPMCLVER